MEDDFENEEAYLESDLKEANVHVLYEPYTEIQINLYHTQDSSAANLFPFLKETNSNKLY